MGTKPRASTPRREFVAIALVGFVALLVDWSTIEATPVVAEIMVPAEGLFFAIWGVLARRHGRWWAVVLVVYGVSLLVMSALVAGDAAGLFPQPSNDVGFALIDLLLPVALGLPVPLAMLLWSDESDRPTLLGVTLMVAPLVFCSSCGTAWVGGKYIASRPTATHLHTFIHTIPIPPGARVVAADNTLKLSDMTYVMPLPPEDTLAFATNDDPNHVLAWYRTLWQRSPGWTLDSGVTSGVDLVIATSPPPNALNVTVEPIWQTDTGFLGSPHDYADGPISATGLHYGYQIDVRCSQSQGTYCG